MKQGLGVIGLWLKENSYVAKDKLLFVGEKMKDKIGDVLEVINYLIIQVQ